MKKLVLLVAACLASKGYSAESASRHIRESYDCYGYQFNRNVFFVQNARDLKSLDSQYRILSHDENKRFSSNSGVFFHLCARRECNNVFFSQVEDKNIEVGGTLEGDIKTALQEIEHRLEHLRSHDYRVQNHGFQALMHTLKREHEAAESHANVYMQHDTSKLGDPNWPLETHNINILKNALRERLDEIDQQFKTLDQSHWCQRQVTLEYLAARVNGGDGSSSFGHISDAQKVEGWASERGYAVLLGDALSNRLSRIETQTAFNAALEENQFKDAYDVLSNLQDSPFKTHLKRHLVASAKKYLEKLIIFAYDYSDEAMMIRDETELNAFLSSIPDETIRQDLGSYRVSFDDKLKKRFQNMSDPRKRALLVELLTAF
ncbi:MAG: hypothetical protein KBD31_03185 [Proteobacteria bacterium]|nr:hypothetical protein [Pseudomonadota bacterium]